MEVEEFKKKIEDLYEEVKQKESDLIRERASELIKDLNESIDMKKINELAYLMNTGTLGLLIGVRNEKQR